MGEKLIEIKKAKKVIFVGDTHGDLDASQKVIKDYLKPGNKIIFLGDYVDRGKFSKENLDFLLEKKKKYPDQIYLLQGNHEGYPVIKFSPAEFWENLNEKEYKKYALLLTNLPLAVSVGPFLALHGALPGIKNLKEINEIQVGDRNWFFICWGDFFEKDGEFLGIDPLSGRPKFGRDYFFKIMKKLNKKFLIRSHQADCPNFMFENSCLTIFTSSVYNREKQIAILDYKKGGKNLKDLKLVNI